MPFLTHPTRVGDDRIIIDAVPTITAGLYGLNDALGGLLQWARATRGPEETSLLEMVRIVDRASQNTALTLVLFDQIVQETADNAVYAPSDADLDHAVGMVRIVAADYSTFSTNSVAVVFPNAGRGLPVWTVDSHVLYGQLVVSGGPPTFVSTSDIHVRLTFRRD